MNSILECRRVFGWIITLMMGFTTGLPNADAEEQATRRFEAADSKGVTARRGDRTLYLELSEGVGGKIAIPRLAAPLRRLTWQGSDSPAEIQVRPEPEEWILNWESRPPQARTLVIELGAPAQLLSEVQPTKATGDGSFYLPAHLATTAGEKIRYEPQTYKNTVGYWVGKNDRATWRFQLETPGKFNVAILQGCGQGQGGSQAKMSFQAPESDQPEATLDFETLETGHFQNFHWRHLGDVELGTVGVVELTIEPKAIQKTALMDVRAIHLVRLPAPRKKR